MLMQVDHIGNASALYFPLSQIHKNMFPTPVQTSPELTMPSEIVRDTKGCINWHGLWPLSKPCL